ncbi:cation:proton antiporter [Marinicella sp. W31]|uniref:cation:proton antiporter n=1 Tax=Marinicella sp. W31 TaxID=3023713 RepID=UPI003756D6DE
MPENIMLIIAIIGIVGSLMQWFAWWIKLPSILFLLLAGFLLGPITGILQPDQIFGDLLFPIVSLAVGVILFEGALTLDFREISGQQKVVRRLVTVGMLVTWVITSTATYYLIKLPWNLSFLFGALVVVTGPTVIVPMLRILKLRSGIANILRWEGIVIDPIGATLAVLVFNFIIAVGAGDSGWSEVFYNFFRILVVGSLVGAVAGFLLGLVLRRHWLPEYLHNVFTLTLVFAVFALSDLLAHESGLLAVTVMGMWLANSKKTHIEDILNFKESLTVLLISGLFILLAARLDFGQLVQLGWMAILLFAVIQFVARPLSVLISTIGSKLSWRERAMLSWIAPRGIVAAAVSALFALRLEQQGYEQASLLVSLTFMVIIGTVVFQSLTAGFVGRWLGVSNPEAKGILIVGSNPVAIAIAEALNKQGFECLLTDSYWRNIQQARMKDIQTYYGNPVSEHADHHLDLVGIGKLLALSMNKDLNYLAATRYKSEFGIANTYTLRNDDKNKDESKHSVAAETRGRDLFSSKVTYAKLASTLAKGGQIKATTLSAEFTAEDYLNKHGNMVIPLFLISPRGRQLRVVDDTTQLHETTNDWTILSMFKNSEDTVKPT